MPTIRAWVLMAAACLPPSAAMAAGQEPAPENPPQSQPSAPAPNTSAEPQATPPQAEPVPQGTVNKLPSGQMRDARQPTESERRKAAKLYLAAAKLYEQ